MLGRSTETRCRRADLGCDHFEVVVDDGTPPG
jgi:hypothetical protein